MRLVTWNVCGSFAAKRPHLQGLGFDVATVQECSPLEVPLGDEPGWSEVLARPLPGGSKWFGALTRSPWRVEPMSDLPDEVNRPWLVPVRVTGPVVFTLLSVWTQGGSPSYTAQARQVVTDVVPLCDGPVVVAGDFNAPGVAGTTSYRQHAATVDLLAQQGLVPAFGTARAVDGAEECAPTYFHQRKLASPWHIDHVFVPAAWADGMQVEVGDFETWVAGGRSDHVPVVVDLPAVKRE